MRAGAGLVTLGVPRGIAAPLIRKKIKEVMLLALPETPDGSLSLQGIKEIGRFSEKADVLVIGPGLGRNLSTAGLVRRLLTDIAKPLVVDADGLNVIAGDLCRLKLASAKIIFTPHPGEMARLCGINVEAVEAQRQSVARKFSREHKLTLVLKGHRTIVADYEGRTYVNKTGNPGMATAGSGDVLSGIISAFLAQGLSSFDAARYAVYLHGLAGDLAAREKTEISLIASDIIDKIPLAIKRSS